MLVLRVLSLVGAGVMGVLGCYWASVGNLGWVIWCAFMVGLNIYNFSRSW